MIMGNAEKCLAFGSLPLTLPDCDIVSMFSAFEQSALIVSEFITSTSPTAPFKDDAMNDFRAHETSASCIMDD
jgi:hypothetical protein